jgi:hypothetical protein
MRLPKDFQIKSLKGPVDIEGLETLLILGVQLGRQDEFKRRLRMALESAYEQGAKSTKENK